MKFTVKLLTADVPNKNGRVYTKAGVESALANVKSPLLVSNGISLNDVSPETGVNLDEASGMIDELHFEGDELIGSVSLLDTPMGKQLLKQMEQDEVAFRTVGTGLIEQVNGLSTVTQYSLLSVSAIPKDTAA